MWLGHAFVWAVVFYCALAWAVFAKTVHHDLGGSVQQRVEQMQGMDGVRIAGDCMSACTLYLGLPGTCVTRQARLGFHSPSTTIGLPLVPEEWERVTRLMAAHYPQGIAEWWLRKARFSGDMLVLSGEQVARMGARLC